MMANTAQFSPLPQPLFHGEGEGDDFAAAPPSPLQRGAEGEKLVRRTSQLWPISRARTGSFGNFAKTQFGTQS